ncbi:MAG: adenylate/guanylate cyclase domain-containing protein [Microthrixaceae bacterium]
MGHEAALELLGNAGVLHAGAGGSRRRELIVHLLDSGATPQQVLDAARRGDLQGLGFDLLLQAGELGLDEMADAVGMDTDELCLLYRHLGVEIEDPDSIRFDRGDVDFVRGLRATISVFPEEAGDEVLQSIAAAMSSMASASISAFVGAVEPGLADEGDELAWTRIITESGEGALELVSNMRGLFRQHLRIAVEHQRSSMRNVESRQLSVLAVGFVDLVGYTSETEDMSVEELIAYTSRFRHRAHDLVTSHGGRLVKHIGDEVMFSSVDPERACLIGLALIEDFSESVSVPRGGVAHGPLVARHGDLYGPVVNMASRLADIAVPGELLVPASMLKDGPMGEVALEPAGRRQLKGFRAPVEVLSACRSG